MLPSFVGIGAPKSGTTWLANALAEHPEICFASVKEPEFLRWENVLARLPEYERLFEPDERTRAAGEFSVNYLADQVASEQALEVVPDARFLVCLRKPVDQIYSHYWHLQRQNFHVWRASGSLAAPAAGEVTFEEALERYADRLIEPAYYADHLERWFARFPRDRFHVELFDDIKACPADVLWRVFTFVGVDPDYAAPSAERVGTGERKGTSPRNAWAAKWGGRIYDSLNRSLYHPLKLVIGPHRADWLKERLRVRQAMERAFRKTGYPVMDPGTRSALIERFREPNDRLGELLGRDLRHWNA